MLKSVLSKVKKQAEFIINRLLLRQDLPVKRKGRKVERIKGRKKGVRERGRKEGREERGGEGREGKIFCLNHTYLAYTFTSSCSQNPQILAFQSFNFLPEFMATKISVL